MTSTQILLPAFNFNGQSLKLPDKCGPTILDHTKQHCHNKRSMITPEAWTPVIINGQCSSIKWIERSTRYILPRIQVFIYIDMYKMTLTWMNERREWIFHSLSTWPVLCNIWRSSLLLTSRPYTRHLFLFFSPPISVFISVDRIVVGWLRIWFQCEVWANVFAAFLQLLPTCRASDALETYKIIRFHWRCTHPFWMQTANQY